MKTINAEIFIVPTQIIINDEYFVEDDENKCRERVGLPSLEKGELLVQVWIRDEESTCWADLGKSCPELYKGTKSWPSYLTLSELEGFREGTASKPMPLKNGVEIVFTPTQLGSRWKHWGKFEDALNKLKSGGYR